MPEVALEIQKTDAIPLIIEKILGNLTVEMGKEEAAKIIKEELTLQLLSSVAVVASDSLYRMAVRMGYEGTEEDFVEFLMTESKDGVINVDNEYPLQSGNYTLSTAIAAVAADETLAPEQKNGMIITFFDGTDWNIFQYNKEYKGESAATDFANADNWTAVKLKRATENISGSVKLTDTIDSEHPKQVSDNTAVTPKAVIDFLASNPDGLVRVNSFENLPAVGSMKVIYLTESSGLYWVFTANGYKIMTPAWGDIKVIRGNTSIAITEDEIVTM